MPPQNGKLKLRDIARLTGHTVGTVSKALHDKPGLAPKTREYILKVARENGYIGNALAGSLRSGRGFNPSGLWHHSQRSGQPFKNTAMRMPGPSYTANSSMSKTMPVVSRIVSASCRSYTRARA